MQNVLVLGLYLRDFFLCNVLGACVCMDCLCLCLSNCTTLIFLEYAKDFSVFLPKKYQIFLVETVFEKVIFSNTYKVLSHNPNGFTNKN